MRPSPEVVSGMRPTRSALSEDNGSLKHYARFRGLMADKLEARKAARRDRSAIRDTVFVSRYGNHRIQITAPREVTLADGTKVKDKPLVAQFKDCVLNVRKAFRHLEDPEVEKIVTRLRAHPQYGPGRDFWEQGDALDESKVRRMAKVAADLESDPEIKDAVLDYITANEFEANVKVVAEPQGAAPTPKQEAKVPSADDVKPTTTEPPAPPARRRGRKPKGESA